MICQSVDSITVPILITKSLLEIARLTINNINNKYKSIVECSNSLWANYFYYSFNAIMFTDTQRTTATPF